MSNNRLSKQNQVDLNILIHAPLKRVWNIFSDNSLLNKWAPHVQNVNSETETLTTGSSRSCEVTINGKTGKLIERITVNIPYERIEYVVDEETFGIKKILNDFGFAVTFTVMDDQVTKLTMQNNYTPKNIFVSMMNTLMIRRNMKFMVNDLIEGLKSYTEEQEMLLDEAECAL